MNEELIRNAEFEAEQGKDEHRDGHKSEPAELNEQADDDFPEGGERRGEHDGGKSRDADGARGDEQRVDKADAVRRRKG